MNPKNWLKVLQTISEVSEEATKVGAYQKSSKKQEAHTIEESAIIKRSDDLM